MAAAVDDTNNSDTFPTLTIRLSDQLPAVDCLQKSEAEFLYRQLFDEADYIRFGISVRKGDTVLDVGGNIGMFALYCILLTEGHVTLFSFEPIPALARLCRSNVERYAKPGLTRGKVLPFGLTQPSLLSGKQSAVFEFYPRYSLVSTSYGWTEEEREAIAERLEGFTVMSGGGGGDGGVVGSVGARGTVESSLAAVRMECPLRTLSSVLEEEEVGRVDLLKVDVEKAEWDVLMGIKDEHWSLIRQVVVETHVIGDRVEKIRSLLEVKGFGKVVVGERSVPKFLGYREYGAMGENLVGDASSGSGILCNIYATRD